MLNRLSIVAIIILLLFLANYRFQAYRLSLENENLSAELNLKTSEGNKCIENLQSQNQAIQLMEQDKSTLETELSLARNAAAKERVKVVTKLAKDPSCEAELNEIKDQLERLENETVTPMPFIIK